MQSTASLGSDECEVFRSGKKHGEVSIKFLQVAERAYERTPPAVNFGLSEVHCSAVAVDCLETNTRRTAFELCRQLFHRWR
jgi:hypothetical protein